MKIIETFWARWVNHIEVKLEQVDAPIPYLTITRNSLSLWKSPHEKHAVDLILEGEPSIHAAAFMPSFYEVLDNDRLTCSREQVQYAYEHVDLSQITHQPTLHISNYVTYGAREILHDRWHGDGMSEMSEHIHYAKANFEDFKITEIKKILTPLTHLQTIQGNPVLTSTQADELYNQFMAQEKTLLSKAQEYTEDTLWHFGIAILLETIVIIADEIQKIKAPGFFTKYGSYIQLALQFTIFIIKHHNIYLRFIKRNKEWGFMALATLMGATFSFFDTFTPKSDWVIFCTKYVCKITGIILLITGGNYIELLRAYAPMTCGQIVSRPLIKYLAKWLASSALEPVTKKYR